MSQCGKQEAIAPYAAVFLKRPASETTEAIEPTILYVFDFENFKKNMDVDPLYTRIYAEFLETILVAAIERIEEIAKMLSDETVTDSAFKTANELLNN